MSINTINETLNHGGDMLPSALDIQTAKNFPNTLSQADSSRLSTIFASFLQKPSNIQFTQQKTRV